MAGNADEPQHRCSVCDETQGRKLYCSRCKTRMYCSKECQRKDWPHHKQVCLKQAMSKEDDHLHRCRCCQTWSLQKLPYIDVSWGKHFKNNCARATYCPDKPACKTFAEKLQRAVRVNQQAGVTDIFTIIPATGAGDNVAFAVVVGTYGARGGVHGNPGEREIRDGHLWFNYELSALSRKHISSMPLTSPSAGAEIHFRQGSGGQEDFDVSYNGAAGPWHDNGIPYACKDSPRVIVAFAFCSQQACKMCAGLFQQHFPAEMWASLSNHKGLNIEREAIKRLLTGLKCQVQTAAEAIMRDEEVKVA